MKKAKIAILAVASFLLAAGCSGGSFDSDADQFIDEMNIEEANEGGAVADTNEGTSDGDREALRISGDSGSCCSFKIGHCCRCSDCNGGTYSYCETESPYCFCPVC
jgi:hypothetical protein